MLGERWEKRWRRRSHSRLRVLLSSRRAPWRLVALTVLAVVGGMALLRVVQDYRQREDWTVAPLTPRAAERFARHLLLESQRGDAAGGDQRGVVLPLYSGIAPLGFSLILELRRRGVTLPVEVPHCGDLSPTLQMRMATEDPLVRFYDICALAANASATMDDLGTRQLFCVDRDHCRAKFRGFDIKVLAVVYSQFEEVMLLDADTLFFENPMVLWESRQYRETGTLFFHDRICEEFIHLGARTSYFSADPEVRVLHRYLEGFDVSPYAGLGIVERAEATTYAPKSRLTAGIQLGFQPSDFLLNSHSWQRRSGHQMDSSTLLWNKARQPRATAILASFIAHNGLPAPPSYGDKELFWLACELAETAYAFSDFAVGAIGWNTFKNSGRSRGHPEDAQGGGPSVLCGNALHHLPEREPALDGQNASDPKPLYINSDSILEWGRITRRMYYTGARSAEVYPGSFTEQKLPQHCPFNVRVEQLDADKVQLFVQRLQFYDAMAGRSPHAWWNPFQ